MTSLARPQFFEGLYIGAADLAQSVDYAFERVADRGGMGSRHED